MPARPLKKARDVAAAIGLGRALPITEEDLVALRQSRLFSALDADEIRALAADASAIVLPKDVTIGGAGEPGQALFCVVKGAIRVVSRMGFEHRSEPLLAPEVFGWTALVPPYRYVSAGITGTACRLLALPLPAVRATLEREDGTGSRMAHQIALLAVARLSQVFERLDNQTLGTPVALG